MLHGREDARVPATFSGRPYAALNSLREGTSSQLRYIEIANVNHFGVFGQFDAKYIPLAYYEEQALDMMWNHLHSGAPLPQHQLVRTVSRGGEAGKATPITLANLPAIQMQPASGDSILIGKGRMTLPN